MSIQYARGKPLTADIPAKTHRNQYAHPQWPQQSIPAVRCGLHQIRKQSRTTQKRQTGGALFTPHTYPAALLLMMLSMLCWGSWANTQKIDQAWRFELFYLVCT